MQKEKATDSESCEENEMEIEENENWSDSGEMDSMEESDGEKEETEGSGMDDDKTDKGDPDWSAVLEEEGQENSCGDDEEKDETNTYIRCVRYSIFYMTGLRTGGKYNI